MTLFVSTSTGAAGPGALPSEARNTGAHVNMTGLQFRTPLTSKPNSTGFAAPDTTTKTVLDAPAYWIAGTPPAVLPAGNEAFQTTARVVVSNASSLPSCS